MTSALAIDERRIFVMKDHGSSPYGLSYWGVWRECGKKATLKAAEAARGLVILDEEEPVSNEKLQMLWVGLYFHAMQEFILEQNLAPEDIIWPEHLAGDINFREAVRLFLGYWKNWGSIEARWGCRVLGWEVPLGEKDPEQIKNILGGYFTGRADAIIAITDPERARANTGLILMPGRYILDFKTSKAKNAKDDDKFSNRNLQSCGYLWLDAMEQGENAAIGTIFDRIYLHKELTCDKSYGAYVAYPQLDTEERLRSVIAIGLRNQREPLADPSACKDFFGGECYFKKSGDCQGF